MYFPYEREREREREVIYNSKNYGKIVVRYTMLFSTGWKLGNQALIAHIFVEILRLS